MKKEYGKGFTLEDLQRQTEAKWAMRGSVGLAIEQGTPAVGGLMPTFTPGPSPLERAQRSIGSAFEAMKMFENPLMFAGGSDRSGSNPNGQAQVSGGGGGNPLLRSQSVGTYSDSSARPIGTYQGMPVYVDPSAVRGQWGFGFSTQPMSGPGVRSTQVGWAVPTPEPIPDQPTGRFQNLDFDE